jgi:hypothetical protein
MAKRTRGLPPYEERRHFPDLVARLDGEHWPASVLDLSKWGVSLLFNRRLKPGDVVLLSLHHIPRRFVCELPVRIILAAEVQGAFLLGAAFTRQLTDQEIAGLL